MASTPECTCWIFESERGTKVKATWACLHDEVRVASKDGTTAQGWSVGLDWWGPADDASIMIQVEPDAPMPVTVIDLRDIATVTPVGNMSDPDRLLQWITNAVAAADALPEGKDESQRLILDEHTTLEVTIRRERHRCDPGPKPLGYHVRERRDTDSPDQRQA